MKKHILISSLLLISLPSFADEQCALDNSLDQIDELHQNNCEATDKIKSCAEVAIDPDEQKKRIEAWFNVAEERKENVIAAKKLLPKNSYGGLFQQDEITKNVYKITHINDFLTFNGKIQNEKTSKLKEVISDKFVKYAERFNCAPIIKTGYTETLYPYDSKFKYKQQFEQYIANDSFKQERDQYFSRINSSPNSEMVCDPIPVETNSWHPVEIQYPPCAGNVAGFFKDNEWTSSTLDTNINSPESNKLAACIKDRLSKGGVIEKINIESSASGLNNSGEASKRFCKKGFKELSRARAETARDKIVPQLFAKAGFDAQGLKVDTFPDGSNGDGTSGPCPYSLKNGAEILKEEFKTPAGKKSLDEHKYVKVNVVFKEIKKPTSGESNFAQKYRCRNFRFECLPKVGEQSVVGQGQSK